MNDLVTRSERLPAISEFMAEAEKLAQSDILPVAFKGKPANVAIAMEMAARSGASLLAIMQNLKVVHGVPTFSSKFLIAQANASGIFSTRIDYEEGNDNPYGHWCIAFANLRNGATRKGTRVSMKMAKDEGWLDRSGSKWKNMPQQMLRWRAASFFVNQFAPECGMGMAVQEDMEDITPQVVEVWPRRMPNAQGVLGPWYDVNGEVLNPLRHQSGNPPPVDGEGAFLPLADVGTEERAGKG